MLFTYNKLLHKYPITTKLLTSGFLFSLGDAVSQICNFLNWLLKLYKEKRILMGLIIWKDS